MQNAVAVMRVSSDKQGFEGDSIDHQKDQIDNYAAARDIIIKKYFVFIESASKEQQPVQEAIDYCKNRKNNTQLFLIKSIDRFTRGGSSLYDHMKTELCKHNVMLVDLYGVISNQKVNTLEHLGVSYSWSVYNPSKKSELLEAERGKDEMRDIMSRMIGAEIRYTRLGYRVRAAPLGYQNQRIETTHGKRFILIPHPMESVWIRRIFDLKVQGLSTDKEIVAQVNIMGFRTRRFYLRKPGDKSQIVGLKGEKQLDIKQLDRIVQNPLYAGVTLEKWTQQKPLKCQFDGLVSINIFNEANKGKVMITKEEGEIKILKGKQLKKRLVSTAINLKYPYKRLVLCPKCHSQFSASASRGRLGKYYPAYHCSKSGHYYRVPLEVFHQTLTNYLSEVRIKNEFIERIQAYFIDDQQVKTQNALIQTDTIKERVSQIETNIKLTIEKIKFLHSEIALRSLEHDLENLSKEKNELLEQKGQMKTQITIDKEDTNKILKQKTNKIPEFIINKHDALIKARLFELLFTHLPTYEDLVHRTASLRPEFELFLDKANN